MATRTTPEVDRLRKTYRDYRQEGVDRRWSQENPGNREMLRELRESMHHLLALNHLLPLTGIKVLDVGCGNGSILAQLQSWGAEAEHLYGVDLIPERIEAARQAYPALTFVCGNAETLNFPDGTFDLILVFTVLSSILDEKMARSLCGEALRVLKPGGAVLCYDFRLNNPYNPHVRGVTRNALARLFPEMPMQVRSLTLLPPLARRLGRWTDRLYPVLVRLPFLRTHNLALLTGDNKIDNKIDRSSE